MQDGFGSRRTRLGPVVAVVGLGLAWLFPVTAAAQTAEKTMAKPASAGAGAKSATRRVIDPNILLGRSLVLNHNCSLCHGGNDDPDSPAWLAGQPDIEREFHVGACTFENPNAKPCFITHPRNLTPDEETGLGRFTERQIFNALRYGLRPEDTPDVTITSTTPGQGNFPLHPHYLAPPMPWPSWRYMSDRELWAIAAYLHRGLKPVKHKIAESEGPPDFWADAYANNPRLKLAPYPAKPFPAASEQEPTATEGPKP